MIRRVSRWAFGCTETRSLELLRIGVGLALLIAFVPVSGELQVLYGDAGWISDAAARELGGASSPLSRLTDAWQLTAVHIVFLVSCLALAVGWKTRWVKWIVWIGFVSYVHRNPAVIYGVDRFLTCFLPILCFAPIGRRWSLDSLAARGPDEPNGVQIRLASACLRLLQLQMAVIFLFTAAHKLRGEMWWSGHALWIALGNFEFARWGFETGPLAWMAGAYALSNFATHAALLTEVAYPFLIWGRRSRPWMLAAACLLHLGIAVLMGLQLFALVALLGHAAFLPRDAWERLDRIADQAAARLRRGRKSPWGRRLAVPAVQARVPKPSATVRG